MEVKIRLLRFVAFLFIFFAATIPDVMAQISSGVRAEFFVQPFPSPYVSDWQTNPSIASLTVFNGSNSPKEVVITLSVTTNDGRQVISGTSSPTVLLRGPNVMNNTSLLHGNLKYYDTGIKSQIIQTGRIPEGTYSACISILGAEGVRLVSEQCREFTIVYADPPQLVYPMDGDSVNTNFPIFQWTPVQVPVQYQVHYVFKMVQLLQGQTPLQALDADIPQYTNENLAATTLQYPLSALPLVAGDTYVWQVQALDQNGFPPASNNGESQIRTFTYQKPVGIVTYHHVTPVGPGTPPVNKNLFTTTTISGTMYGAFTIQQNKPFLNQQGRYGHRGSGGSNSQSGPQPLPLANTTLNLVDEYVLLQGYDPVKRVFVEAPVPSMERSAKVIATTTTDASGNFSFSFAQTKNSPDTVSQNTTVTLEGGRSATGTLVKVYRIIVQSPYFCSPDYDIDVQTGQSDNIGQQFALARSYSLSITLTPNVLRGGQQLANSSSDLSGYAVYLLRQSRPEGVPDNEGFPAPPSADTVQSMQVVAEATADDNGQVTFSNLVQNNGPNDQYFVYAAPDPGSPFFYTTLPTSFQFGYNDNPTQYPGYQVTPNTWNASSVFNSEYVAPEVSITQLMWAAFPKVAGYIYRSDNPNEPVGSAETYLEYFFNDKVNRFTDEFITMNDGYFNFHLGASDLGSGYQIEIYKNGYRDTIISVNNGKLLTMGQQVYFPKILLQPAFNVTGKVVDEEGNPVQANVTIGEGTSVEANLPTVLRQQYFMNGKERTFQAISYNTGFQAPAVSGNQQIIIDPTPYDNSLFPDTEYVNITQNEQNLGTFVLKKKLHRLKVVVRTIAGVSIPRAHVEIQNVGSFETDNSGAADTTFISASNSFSITVIAPDGKDFIGQVLTAYVPDSKDWTIIPVKLRSAIYVEGRVLVGGTPIPQADVFLDRRQSPHMPPIAAKTNNQGVYVLHDVPPGTRIKIEAAKSQSDLIGADTTLVANIHSKGLRNVNFHLRIYNGMDISKLMGFPIEVTSLTLNGSSVMISGNFVALDSNGIFGPSDPKLMIGFANIQIDSGIEKDSVNVPYAVPKVLPMVTDVNSIPLRIYSALEGAQGSAGGIRVDTSGNGGEFVGPTYIDPVSFKKDPAFSNISLPELYLGLPNAASLSDRMQLPTITSSGVAPPGTRNGFILSDAKGNSIRYVLFSLHAVADSSKSTLNGNNVTLATTIHTSLRDVPKPDIDLDVGNVTLHSDRFDPISSETPVKIAIENWTIEGDKWSITESGFSIDSGMVRTGLVNVPFTGLEIDSTELKNGVFQADTVSLSDVLTIQVMGKWYFGFDNGAAHWSLSVTPNGNSSSAAHISSLPGAAVTDELSINNIKLLSDGTAGFTMDNTSSPISLYKVASFQPTGLNLYSTHVNVTGTIDLGIPALQAQSCVISYSKPNGVTTFGFTRFPVSFNVNGVALSFPADQQNPETLDSTGFHASGTVAENGVFGFNVQLYRTVDSTSVWTVSGQQFNVSADGTSNLANVVGSMEVQQNSWTNFSFSGDLVGSQGASGRLGFVVHGDLIGQNQKISVKNISMPFIGIGLTFVPTTGEIYGSVNLNDTLSGGTTIVATADISIGGDGWFFLAGGTLTLSSPQISIEAGLLIGNHSMIDEIKGEMQTVSYYYSQFDSLPPEFPKSVSGFYFEGAVTMPIPGVPSASFSFGPIQGKLSVTMGADLRLAMSFTGSGNTYDVGIDVFAQASVAIDANFQVACAAVSAEILADVGLGGEYQSNGNWYVDGSAILMLKGTASAGLGDCGNTCSGSGGSAPCALVSQSGSISIGVKGHYGTDYKSVSFILNASPQ